MTAIDEITDHIVRYEETKGAKPFTVFVNNGMYSELEQENGVSESAIIKVHGIKVYPVTGQIERIMV